MTANYKFCNRNDSSIIQNIYCTITWSKVNLIFHIQCCRVCTSTLKLIVTQSLLPDITDSDSTPCLKIGRRMVKGYKMNTVFGIVQFSTTFSEPDFNQRDKTSWIQPSSWTTSRHWEGRVVVEMVFTERPRQGHCQPDQHRTATLVKPLRGGVERLWAFPCDEMSSWTELSWTELNWTSSEGTNMIELGRPRPSKYLFWAINPLILLLRWR